MFDTDVVRYARIHGRAGGFRDAVGVFHDHNWATNGVHIIDFTADQFGCAPKILVAEEGDQRFVANFKSMRHTKINCDSALIWARSPVAENLITYVDEFFLGLNENEAVLEAHILDLEP